MPDKVSSGIFKFDENVACTTPISPKKSSSKDGDNKSDQGHSGLGLSIAKQIIDAHDGYISADNVIEGGNIIGAKFIVNLPLAD